MKFTEALEKYLDKELWTEEIIKNDMEYSSESRIALAIFYLASIIKKNIDVKIRRM